MTQLGDLSDDCLMEVLDRVPANQLLKMRRINKRLKRLASIKMGVKIMAIEFKESKNRFTSFSLYNSNCSHVDSVSPDQVLHLDLVKFTFTSLMISPSYLWYQCYNVKAIDFGHSIYPTVLKAFRRCPQLECVKLRRKFVDQDECDRVLDEIGQRIVHLTFEWRTNQTFVERPFLPSDRVLETVAAKCPNIKRLEWVNRDHPTSDLMAKFQLLPKNCWIRLVCHDLTIGAPLDDAVDDLEVEFRLNWSQLGHRYDRLSKLKLNRIKGPFNGVVFAGLKRLDFNESCMINREPINHLLVSGFPRLQEFCFSASAGYSEVNYEDVFQQMASVKKLAIKCGKNWLMVKYPKLPPLATIHKLKNLETIDLIIMKVDNDWHPSNFILQVEKYVDEISSLKKLTFDMRHRKKGVWDSVIEHVVKRLKLKQSRVEVALIAK